MPPATMDAFRDHGRVEPTLTRDVDGARHVLEETRRLDLDLDGVTDHLVQDGVDKFSEAFDKLLGAVAGKRQKILGSRLDAQWIKAANLEPDMSAALDRAAREGWTRRLWRKDASLWPGGDAEKWLGWLDAGQGLCVDLPVLEGLGDEVKKRGFSHAVLLGMGGSSLGPEVLAETFGSRPGHPELHRPRLHRSGSGAPGGGDGRSGPDALHRLQQVRLHARTGRAAQFLLRPRREGRGAGESRRPLYRRH